MTDAAFSTLGRMQEMLESIYQVQACGRASEFLITDALVARALQGGGAQATSEQLLVAQDDDSVLLSLYLDDDLLSRLAAADPWTALSESNLEDFLVVLEGVSHFVYLAWNIRYDRPVTRLDLELQAEVDKYVVALIVLLKQYGSVTPDLHARLFRQVAYRADLDGAAQRLYRRANEYAARYCRVLERDYVRDAARRGMFRDLRRFYRLAFRHKLAHIEHLH